MAGGVVLSLGKLKALEWLVFFGVPRGMLKAYYDYKMIHSSWFGEHGVC
jgi:hypothetical protein